MDTERLGIDIKTAPNYAPSTIRFSNAQITVSTIIVPIASLKPSDVPLHAPSKSATLIDESDILWWVDDIEDGKLYCFSKIMKPQLDLGLLLFLFYACA